MSSTAVFEERQFGRQCIDDQRDKREAHDAAEPVDVSICIANWNCRTWLHELLTSLTAEKQGVRLEVVVVDNASTDGAPDMVAAEFPEVLLIRNDANRGFSKANNQAARAARGKYVFFLNNDTVLPDVTLRKLLDFAEAHPDAAMIGPRLRGADGEVQVSYRSKPSVASLLHRTGLLRWTGLFRRRYLKYRRTEFDPNRTREVAILMGAAVLMRRRSFLAWGQWDEDFTFGGEDMELSIRAGQHGKLIYFPEVEIKHYGRVSTRRHVAFASTQIAAGMVKYLRKTGTPRLGILAYKAAMTLDAPITVIVKGIESLIRSLRGKNDKAKKSRLSMRVARHFLTRGLWTFWRA